MASSAPWDRSCLDIAFIPESLQQKPSFRPVAEGMGVATATETQGRRMWT